MIKTYFTKQSNVKLLILEELDKAQSRVVVAVAWFTESELFQKLLDLQAKGIQVELVITKHPFNQQSRNNYSLLSEKNGFFAEIGSDDQLMHMKFCIIDSRIVISGSANWTNRAFTENNEEVTFVEGYNERVLSFEDEFLRLKKIAGFDPQSSPFLLNIVFKKLNIIKALLQGEEYDLVNQYILQIQDFSQVAPIVLNLKTGNWTIALQEIEAFQKSNTQLFDLTGFEKEQLRSEIRLLSQQIESIQIQRLETEALIDQFNHQFVIELNPLLIEVIKLKKKLYEKLSKRGSEDKTFHDLEHELNDAQEEFEEERTKDYQDLNEEEEKSLKKSYREAVKLCYWDLQEAQLIFETEEKANEVFNALHEAYTKKDKEKVEEILRDIKLGTIKSNYDLENELDLLKEKKQHLKLKYQNMLKELSDIFQSDIYQLLIKLKDWREYFEEQKIELQNEITELKEKYYEHE
jgi:hypothetical protein